MLAHIDPISSGHFNEIRGLFKGSSINDVTVCDGSTNLSNKKRGDGGGGSKIVQNCVTSFMNDPYAEKLSVKTAIGLQYCTAGLCQGR